MTGERLSSSCHGVFHMTARLLPHGGGSGGKEEEEGSGSG